MKHIVMFSGGIGSYATAKIVAARHGTDNLVLLFSDVLMEDEDLYRFVDEAAKSIGKEITRICEGRTPWQVFHDVRFLGNSRVDPCSKILKRDFLDAWLKKNCDPEETTVYVGIDWTEIHRFEGGRGKPGLRARMADKGWKYEAPLCEPPYLSKQDFLEMLKADGIEPPRLYAMGFPHNNCGGVCVKAGQGQFKLLYEKLPERYLDAEAKEESLRAKLGNVSILTDRSGDKKKKPLSPRVPRST